jgi:hypothetical protein
MMEEAGGRPWAGGVPWVGWDLGHVDGLKKRTLDRRVSGMFGLGLDKFPDHG